jgi:hypothetical protein
LAGLSPYFLLHGYLSSSQRVRAAVLLNIGICLPCHGSTPLAGHSPESHYQQRQDTLSVVCYGDESKTCSISAQTGSAGSDYACAMHAGHPSYRARLSVSSAPHSVTAMIRRSFSGVAGTSLGKG